MQLGEGKWKDFFAVCDEPDEISLTRPFYPRVSREGVEQQSLIRKLGVGSIIDLLRLCDLGGGGRRQACSIFWTLGANAVGKAAIAGWQELVIPALGDADNRTRIWPFDGKLDSLLASGGIVLAETYPAEYYKWFVPRGVTKASPESRKEFGSGLAQWVRGHEEQITASDELMAEINSGFVDDDRFDAVVGLLAMLKILFREQSAGEPTNPDCRTVEGWMLGRSK
ncbi:MAG TPA: hypothetical protein VN776_05430 [Terracidiphilus sp.]|nr:hypothetical protein [Terracidiphilus sp.]